MLLLFFPFKNVHSAGSPVTTSLSPTLNAMVYFVFKNHSLKRYPNPKNSSTSISILLLHSTFPYFHCNTKHKLNQLIQRHLKQHIFLVLFLKDVDSIHCIAPSYPLVILNVVPLQSINQ